MGVKYNHSQNVLRTWEMSEKSPVILYSGVAHPSVPEYPWKYPFIDLLLSRSFMSPFQEIQNFAAKTVGLERCNTWSWNEIYTNSISGRNLFGQRKLHFSLNGRTRRNKKQSRLAVTRREKRKAFPRQLRWIINFSRTKEDVWWEIHPFVACVAITTS